MKLWTYIVILALIMSGVGMGIYEYMMMQAPKEKFIPVVEEGDRISVRYYGYIYYGGERRIFDTNIEEVAKDNTTYPKTVTFQWPKKFTLLTFTVGDGSMIKGFDEGVRGMHLNETKTIVVPPEKGYRFDWSKVKNESYVQSISVVENITLEQFNRRFSHENPKVNAVYKDKMYGWYTQVLYVNPSENIVTIQNNPDINTDYMPFDDPSLLVHVDSVNGTTITFHYIIKRVPILLPSGGIIDELYRDHFRINFNKEVAGKNLYFVVTVVKIEKS